MWSTEVRKCLSAEVRSTDVRKGREEVEKCKRVGEFKRGNGLQNLRFSFTNSYVPSHART